MGKTMVLRALTRRGPLCRGRLAGLQPSGIGDPQGNTLGGVAPMPSSFFVLAEITELLIPSEGSFGRSSSYPSCDLTLFLPSP